MIEHVASTTFENIKIRPNLPIDFPPRNSVSFSDKSYKLFKIPRFINNMLGPYLSIRIDIGLSFSTVQDLPLTHSEEFVAMSTFVKVVGLFFE